MYFHENLIKALAFSLVSQGVPYYVRVSAYNVRGWGPAQTTSPTCAAPSSELQLHNFVVSLY